MFFFKRIRLQYREPTLGRLWPCATPVLGGPTSSTGLHRYLHSHAQIYIHTQNLFKVLKIFYMYSTFLLLNYYQRVIWAQSCILEMRINMKEYKVLYAICSIHVHFIEMCMYAFLCGYTFWFQCYILILFKSLNFKFVWDYSTRKKLSF